jgi:uncharacterized protein
MFEELEIFIFFLIWLFSAYFGSFSSWGVSALSIALMVMLWVPPQMAGITFKLWKLWDNVGWLILFHKHGHIPRRFVLGGGIALLFGSFLGSYLIISIPDAIMYLGCGISMLLLTIVSIFRKEQKWEKISKIREYMGYGTYFILSIVGNLFPAGSGVWYFFNNTLILKLSPLESKGIASVLALFWFVGTLFGILLAGQYNLTWALSLGAGMFIGWYFWTKHIIRIGNDILKNLLLCSIMIFAFYFLYLAYNSWQ